MCNWRIFAHFCPRPDCEAVTEYRRELIRTCATVRIALEECPEAVEEQATLSMGNEPCPACKARDHNMQGLPSSDGLPIPGFDPDNYIQTPNPHGGEQPEGVELPDELDPTWDPRSLAPEQPLEDAEDWQVYLWQCYWQYMENLGYDLGALLDREE